MLLVTGPTGFIGRHLVKRLVSEGHKVLCFIKTGDKEEVIELLQNLGVSVAFGDITNRASIEKVFNDYPDITSVIHLAAIIKPSPTGEVKEFIDVNVSGTRSIVQACEKRGIKRLIFYSTDFVLYSYHNIYGDSKAQAEEIIRQSDLDYTILRPTPVYGVGDDKNFDSLFALLKKYPVVPSVKCVMQPVHFNDVVEATVAVLANKKTYRKEYNLPGGSTVTFTDILHIISSELGVKRYVIPVPNRLMQFAVRVYERCVSNPVVHDYQISKWILNKELSIEESKRDFGYNPIPFEKGMRETMRLLGISRRVGSNGP